MKIGYTNQLQRDPEHQSYTRLEYDLMKEREKKVRAGQMALSVTADFEEKTWTFQFENDDFVVRAGKFLILPSDMTPYIEPTPSSTVDLEREAEEKYPHVDDKANQGLYSDTEVTELERAAYIKGRQTTSQKGLDELIEWLKYCQENGWVKLEVTELITKATELLNTH